MSNISLQNNTLYFLKMKVFGIFSQLTLNILKLFYLFLWYYVFPCRVSSIIVEDNFGSFSKQKRKFIFYQSVYSGNYFSICQERAKFLLDFASH